MSAKVSETRTYTARCAGCGWYSVEGPSRLAAEDAADSHNAFCKEYDDE